MSKFEKQYLFILQRKNGNILTDVLNQKSDFSQIYRHDPPKIIKVLKVYLKNGEYMEE